jgi:type VI secretion system protein ImpH
MAAQSRRTDTTIGEDLFAQPYGYDFFQAVRLLERLYATRLPVGKDNNPKREAVRFHALPSLSFPPSQLARISPEDETTGAPPQLTIAFMGLFGPLGVLPAHYTELVLERLRYRDKALAEFLDIFNHRFISLFYRAWEKYRFPIAYERGAGDAFTQYLFSIIGMGTRGLHKRLSLPDEGLLLYGGLIAQKPHSVNAMAAVLSDYFAVPVTIEQFYGQWLKLEAENLTRCGKANHCLGSNTVVGTRVWDTQAKFRVKFGPLSFTQFYQFLPIGSAFNPAQDLTRLFAGMEFDFDLQLVLKAAEVPTCQLATGSNRQPRLGWTTWLKTREFTRDDRQVVLSHKTQPDQFKQEESVDHAHLLDSSFSLVEETARVMQ